MKKSMPPTLNSTKTPVEICIEYGWKVGIQLVGDEGYGPTVLEITAIGEKQILAKRIKEDGMPIHEDESIWSLKYRDWICLKR